MSHRVSRAEADNEIKRGKVLRSTSLSASENPRTHEVLQVLVIGDDIDRVQRGLKIIGHFLKAPKMAGS